ncbi:hypothetical protein SAMN05421821_110147 [Mucilaginibacter lappiensis]|uniref:DUF4412 domain-containing protein n=1 Tax=Mucilaginibacter lappiensis TaxID=354630 RepID=A0ABR6PMY5_9SPHI|nr:hypothetical protein [Mucilaginibacter lappiensis]MBB6111128.1 hypothetical protein [Mucilaginibacter lappiensis]SIR69872.1 hypothetical protein SAMN05421821_110147 [Mucilaginibacter lappiensis]
MKPLYTYLTVTLFTLFTMQAFAQNMNAVNNMLNRQNMQFNMQMQMQMNMMMLNRNQSNYQFNYLVTMKDSSQIFVHSKIYSDTARHKTYLIFVDKSYSKRDTNRSKKIYVSQTLSIARNLGGNGSPDEWYKGMAKDSCWMFKAISGFINAYSMLSQTDNSNFDAFTLVAIQKGDGPVIKLTADNLKLMVGQDVYALENIQKKNYYKAIKKYNRNAEKAAKK